MSYDCSKEEFIRDFSKEIQKSSAAFFIGSGLSRPAGYAGWKEVLKECASDIGLDIDKETDLITLAEYYVNSKKSRSKIDNTISEFFSKPYEPTINHLLLASLPVTSYWTTNYDRLLERAFAQKDRAYAVLTDDNSLKKFIDKSEIILHKLHGDVEAPGEAVITKKDYEEFASKHEILLAKLKGEMCSRSFLFLGYSMSDTDINHILTRIRLFFKGSPPKKHYSVMQRVKVTDPDYIYKQRKQEHHMEDLKSYGIHTVLVDDYSEIADMLNEIRKRIFINRVVISGSYENSSEAAEFGKYARDISKWLIEKNYIIISGYGKNLGAEVVAGAFEGCQKSRGKTKSFSDNVILYPFPFKSSIGEGDRKALYTQLRENMIQNTCVTIIISGTKKKNRKTIVSDGTLEEIRISQRQGNLIIPVAVTGGAAALVWDEVNSADTPYTRSPEFQTLKHGASYEEVLNAVRAILKPY